MLARLFPLFIALVGGALASQFPAFFHQYLQRLGGRLDQALKHVSRLEEAAREENLTLGAYIQSFLTSSEPIIVRQGKIMETEVAEVQQLQTALDQLVLAPPFERLLVFSRHYDFDIARATLTDFSPAFQISIEGGVHAGIGALLGLILAAFLRRIARLLAPRPRKT